MLFAKYLARSTLGKAFCEKCLAQSTLSKVLHAKLPAQSALCKALCAKCLAQSALCKIERGSGYAARGTVEERVGKQMNGRVIKVMKILLQLALKSTGTSHLLDLFLQLSNLFDSSQAILRVPSP